MILETLRLLFGCPGHHFGYPGFRGDTQWTHWGSDLGFHRFLNGFGEPPGTYFGHFFSFSVIRGGKMTDSLQVHVFCGPEMEMMPEWNGCMCHNHCKNHMF
jgi:hypothetical protein